MPTTSLLMIFDIIFCLENLVHTWLVGHFGFQLLFKQSDMQYPIPGYPIKQTCIQTINNHTIFFNLINFYLVKNIDLISDQMCDLASFLFMSIMHGRIMPQKSSMKISEVNIASWVANSLVLSTIKYGIVKNNDKNSMLSILRTIVSNNVNIGKLYDPLLYFFPG